MELVQIIAIYNRSIVCGYTMLNILYLKLNELCIRKKDEKSKMLQRTFNISRKIIDNVHFNFSVGILILILYEALPNVT